MQNKKSQSPNKQRGISLYVVAVFVMLSMLLALWASRTSLFNEMIVGNDADYQRALEAAQALMQDAELDIKGEQANGDACLLVSGKLDVCRPDEATGANKVWIPNEEKDVSTVFAALDSAPTKCIKGLCLKRTGEQDFWNDKVTLAAMRTYDVGARYGQFTGAEIGAHSNPILKLNQASTPSDEGGWYWVEIMPYDADAGNSGLITNGSQNLSLNLIPNVAYRITAIARGLKPSTQVILQSTFVLQKRKN